MMMVGYIINTAHAGYYIRVYIVMRHNLRRLMLSRGPHQGPKDTVIATIRTQREREIICGTNSSTPQTTRTYAAHYRNDDDTHIDAGITQLQCARVVEYFPGIYYLVLLFLFFCYYYYFVSRKIHYYAVYFTMKIAFDCDAAADAYTPPTFCHTQRRLFPRRCRGKARLIDDVYCNSCWAKK